MNFCAIHSSQKLKAMPFQDVIQSHFLDAEKLTLETKIAEIETLLQSKLRNLSEEENNKYGSISEKNKLFVNRVRDYQLSQPALSSPDVDWAEFTLDFEDRVFLELAATRLQALVKAMLETKRLHDYDNYQNALIDYAYTQYKNRTQPGLGYDSKEDDLKQFFPSGGPSDPSPENP